MKNKIVLALIVLLSFGLTSCNDDDASKDVSSLVKKMNYYCDQYDLFMEDGKIELAKDDKDDKSEELQLKKIAKEYYEAMNKINKKVKEEQEKAAKGKKIKGYEKEYKQALIDQKEAIDAATARFEATLMKIKK